MPSAAATLAALKEATKDTDLTWGFMVACVMLANQRSLVSKSSACELLELSDADFNIWRNRFASVGSAVLRDLRYATTKPER